MQICVLGRVTVLAGQPSQQVRRAQTRGILALLALNTGRVVTLDSIAEAMWGESLPRRARARIHTCVSEIRRCLQSVGAADLIVSDRYGYLLDAPQDCLDAHRREQELRHARRLLSANDPAAAERHLHLALAMGKGGPLADAAGVFVEPARLALEEQRLGALEDLASARLGMRRYDEVVSDLLPLVEQHPFRERLRGRLMVALHCSGRQAQALRLFRNYRAQLAERDGLDPGREITDLADAILQDEVKFARDSTLLPDVDGRCGHVGMHQTAEPALLQRKPHPVPALGVSTCSGIRGELADAPIAAAAPAEGPDRGEPGNGRGEDITGEPPQGLPRYRLLTGLDDDKFCGQVSQALSLGYRLHGGVSVTHDGEKVIVAQAVVWPGGIADP